MIFADCYYERTFFTCSLSCLVKHVSNKLPIRILPSPSCCAASSPFIMIIHRPTSSRFQRIIDKTGLSQLKWPRALMPQSSSPEYQQLPLPLLSSDLDLDLESTGQDPSRPRHHGIGQTVPSAGVSAWLWKAAPFFIAAPLGRTTRQLPKANSTTYLNGIRGLACWVVLNFHLVMGPWRESLSPGWGNTEPPNMSTHHFLTLPVVRILYAGEGSKLSPFIRSITSRHYYSRGP